MRERYLHPDEFELANRDSSESKDSFDLDEEDPETQGLTTQAYRKRDLSTWEYLVLLLRRLASVVIRQTPRANGLVLKSLPLPSRSHSIRRLLSLFYGFALTILTISVLTAVFRPSYTHLPQQYQTLRQRAIESDESGRANALGEKVFIVASIFDPEGDLAQGPWGQAVLDLVDILGPSNVFLSIYENDAGHKAKNALEALESKVECDHELVFEEHLDPDTLPHVTLPDKTTKVKRIEYLAEVRNRALRPLETSDVKWDKIIYLNDVIFDPIDAAQLLFSTTAGGENDGRTKYRAACAVDFINPFKFYDTFATRDAEGYSMGVPFFPWFTDSGNGQSRQDVLDQKEAVMVRSCWGGIVAFDDKYFQFEFADKLTTLGDITKTSSSGFRFRAEEDTYWDASECCLIHADIQSPDPTDTGIYLNPYIRVAYDVTTFSWLSFTRRFERLYTPIHWLINHLVGLPWKNPRRAEIPGAQVEEKVWIPDSNGGSFQSVTRNASHAGFCGVRSLQVLLDHPIPGHKPYESLPIPSS